MDGQEIIWLPLPKAVVETMANVDSALGRACRQALDRTYPSGPVPAIEIPGADSYEGPAGFDYNEGDDRFELWTENDAGDYAPTRLSVAAIPRIMEWMVLVSGAAERR